MMFDVVVGNPPFQETHPTGSRKAPSVNLWSKFWVQSLRLAKDDGIVSLITPLRWMNPGYDISGEYTFNGQTRLWDVFNSFSSQANVSTVAEHFLGVGSTFGYVIVDKGDNKGLWFTHGYSTHLGFMPMSGHDRVFKKLSVTGNLKDIFGVDTRNRSRLRVSVPMTRVLKPENIEILNADQNPVMGNKRYNNYAYIYVPDLKTAQQVKDKVIECIDILMVHCRYSGFMSKDILGMISFK